MRGRTGIPFAIASIAAMLAMSGAASADPARCTANVVHPLSVHVTALDPIARGAVVRLRVSATSAVPVDRAEVQLVSTGGATNQGVTSFPLGALVPGRAAQGVFTLAIPPTGGRQYVQFLVSGVGPYGRLTRGACYNLLPDGPAETGRLVIAPQGRRVMEFFAKRIQP